jgi:asparagine synthase (glutamine-hydrolysing)
MTALSGYWDLAGGAAREPCARILAAQSLYGKDEEAFWSEGGIALGRRIHRLLPEDRHDRGPEVAADGMRALVADLRLDNRDALLGDLGLSGADGAKLSDAAVLMKALEAWDLDAIPRLVGDFAFALWDGARQRLVLARDFVGQRPLYFHRGRNQDGAGFIAFASMGKGLHALPDIPYRPNVDRAADFLALLPERGSHSFFEGVERVEPGHILIADRAGERSLPYWNPDVTPFSSRSDEDYVEEFRHRLDVAVARRLRGQDVVGAHLSAGLDSNAVAATAARLLADRPGGRVVAFTSVPHAGFAGEAPLGRIGDEGPLAARTASLHPNMEHVTISAGHRSPASALDRNFVLFERPIQNLCNHTWWDAINDEAKSRGLSVVLTGQAGNFSISHTGYELLSQLLGRGRLLRLAGEMRALRAYGMPARFIAQITAGPFVPAAGWRLLARLAGKERDAFADRGVRRDRIEGLRRRAADLGVDTSLRPRRDAARERIRALQSLDLGNYNKGMLAGWGLDFRDPTADRDLVEFCLRVPLDQYLAAGRPRSLALRALADRVHPDVLAEKRKGFQAADWQEGVAAARGEIEGEIARLDACAPAAAVVDLDDLRALLRGWPAHEADEVAALRKYRGALMRGLSVGHFLRRASGSNQ